MDKKNIEILLNNSNTMTEFVTKLGYNLNGYGFNRAKTLINEHGFDINHFDRGVKNRVYDLIEKKCPVCTTQFITQKGHKKEKITCSKGCANSFFRSGQNNPNFIDGERSYRNMCAEHHKMECIICGEDKVIDVHHYDENRENNRPENLIPLCPTHHRYYHSEYKYLVEDKIKNYIENWRGSIIG